jgi:hypothetical protein
LHETFDLGAILKNRALPYRSSLLGLAITIHYSYLDHHPNFPISIVSGLYG